MAVLKDPSPSKFLKVLVVKTGTKWPTVRMGNGKLKGRDGINGIVLSI